MILWIALLVKGRKEMRLWFEGIIKRREAFEGVQWKLSMFEHQEEDVGKEREIKDARDNHLE